MIKKYIPSTLKNRLIRWRDRMSWKGSYRIFCISVQRTGTTSVGDFFMHFGYPVARWGHSWRNQWTKSWYDGDYEAIFNSKDFKSFQVFEDDPWWMPDFYKVLYHRFPKAKFVLFTRDSDAWFKSMVSHSGGQTPGNTKVHCKTYRREKEFYHKVDNDPTFVPTEDTVDNLLPLQGHEEHYKDLYEIHTREIIDFFKANAPGQFIHCDLTDAEKWKKMGDFFGINVPDDFTIYSNKTKK